MSAREQFTWSVPVQLENGRTVTETVRAFWSPSHDTTKAGVETTARVQAQVHHKQPAAVVGGAELVTA